jgi:hypothetical protein
MSIAVAAVMRLRRMGRSCILVGCSKVVEKGDDFVDGGEKCFFGKMFSFISVQEPFTCTS